MTPLVGTILAEIVILCFFPFIFCMYTDFPEKKNNLKTRIILWMNHRIHKNEKVDFQSLLSHNPRVQEIGPKLGN